MRELNGAIRSEIYPKLIDIRRLQRTVVALSTSDWTWYGRLPDGKTLWQTWRRAVATHRIFEPPQRAADALAGETNEAIAADVAGV